MAKPYLLLIVALLMISACAAPPKWIDNPQSVLDANDYLIGIGSGKSYEEALSNAHTNLAQQVSVKVESITDLNSTNIESGGKEFYSESITKASKLTVDQTLKGMTIARQENDKKTYYVMVTLNKSLMLNAMKGELDKLYNSVAALYDEAQNLAGNGKVLSAIKNYIDAQAILPGFYAKKQFYDNFAAMPYPVPGNLTLGSIDAGIRKLLTSLAFETVSGDHQTGKTGTQLPEQVVFRAIYRTSLGERIPLSGFPVKVSFGDNTLIEKGATDNDGYFKVNVIATPQSGTRGKVLIKADAFMLPAYMLKSAEVIAGEASFNTSESSAINVKLSIKDEKGIRLEKVERNITKILNNNNVQVSNVSPLMMQGVVTLTDLRPVEGIGATKQVAKVRLDLQFGVEKTKEILGSVSGTGQGLSEKSEKDAVERAYDNISISNRDLAAMLSTASDKIQSALANADKYNEPAKPVVQPKPETPVQILPEASIVKPESVAGNPDKHWFTPQDRIYISEEFTSNTYKLPARVGKFINEIGSGFNVKAQILDYSDNVNVTSEFYYLTAPAAINNVKQGDLVFVYYTYKAPETEKQAKTKLWEMVRVTEDRELFNGRVYVSSGYWAPLEAMRVIINK